jgi:hypothetical protein
LIFNKSLRVFPREGSQLDIQSVTVCDVFGVKYFEVLIRGIGSVDIWLDDMKRLGVTNTLNGTKKVREWLQTEEGRAYIQKRIS